MGHPLVAGKYKVKRKSNRKRETKLILQRRRIAKRKTKLLFSKTSDHYLRPCSMGKMMSKDADIVDMRFDV